MMNKTILGLCGFVLSLQCFAEPNLVKMSQEQFNQSIQKYTDQVNATKHILDEENAQIEPKEQSKAFCSRLNAYQNIARISKGNLELDTAKMMLIIANNFLDRQKQSLEQSGISLDTFCTNKAES